MRKRGQSKFLLQTENHSGPFIPLYSLPLYSLQFSYSHPDYKVRVPGTVVLEAAKAIAERRQYLKPKMGG